MPTEKFRERLRKIERGNYKDLARRADILPSRMQRLKSGIEPVIGVVIALARAGGVSVQWLAKGEGTKEKRALADAEQKPHVAIRSVPNVWRRPLRRSTRSARNIECCSLDPQKPRPLCLYMRFLGIWIVWRPITRMIGRDVAQRRSGC